MTRLTTPEGAPFRLELEAWRQGARRRLTVAAPDLGRSRDYRLEAAEQDDWFDFYAALARDFGTRMPLNRRPAAQPPFAAPGEPLLTEPVHPDILYGYGDPAMLRVEEADGPAYFLVVTSNDAPHAFPILRSSDLKDWRLSGFAFREGEKPAWVAEGAFISDCWAPELHRVGGHYLLCFSARERDRSLSIGIARAASPEGPFEAANEPLLRGGVIDSHIFAREGAPPILYWKEDSNGVWPRLLADELAADGALAASLFDEDEDRRLAAFVQAAWPWAISLEPMEQFFLLQPLVEAVVARFAEIRRRLETRGGEADRAILQAMRTPVFAQPFDPERLQLIGEREIVLVNDLEWEGHLIEGIWVTEQEGLHYLFYSGNDFSTAEYGIGVAVGPTPLGPFRKMERPLLRSTAEWWGPGHPSVAIGPDGTPRLFYHAFFPGRAAYKAFRALLAVRLGFSEAGAEIRA